MANITSGRALSIVTGGAFFDGTRNNAQLIVWNGSTLAVQNLTSWFWLSNTRVNSVAIGNFTGSANLDIITGGSYNDTFKNNAQLINWDGGNLAMKSLTTWSWISNTMINSVVVGNFTGSSVGPRTIVGAEYYDNIRSVAQLSTWA